MRLTPPLQTKHLSKTEPGELVKYRVGTDDLIGIVAEVPEATNNRLVILLNTTGGPSYAHYNGIDPLVLSYGRNYEFSIAQCIFPVKSNANEFENNGAMLVDFDRVLIRVFGQSGRHLVLYYDIKTGSARNGWENSSTQVALLRWDIRLLGAKDSDPPIFSFPPS